MSESAAIPVSHNVADPVKLNDVCCSFAGLNSCIRFGTLVERRLDQAAVSFLH